MLRFTNNAPDVIAYLDGCKSYPKEAIRAKVEFAVRYLHEGVTSRTPVHTGMHLRNWVWSKGSPATGSKGDPGGVSPGATSQMALGSEPRRPAAQAEVDATMRSLSYKDPFDIYYLSNNGERIMELEYGRLPSPGRSRSPAGMARITMKELRSLMKGKY